MALSVQIRDETTSGETTNSMVLEFPTERVTVREVIRSRVYQEVKDYNVKAGQRPLFRGLVQPSDAERELNGYKLRDQREINWQKQFEIALEAFERNSFILLINDRQAESLDEEIMLDSSSQISFLKMVPLVGG